MTQDIIDLVNQMGTEENVKDGIQFSNVDGGATLTDLYAADENDDAQEKKKYFSTNQPLSIITVVFVLGLK